MASVKLSFIRYKLVSHHYTTYNETPWRDASGKWLLVKAAEPGNELCTESVVHFYDHPVLAVLFDPIHARIGRPRLLKIRVSEPVAHDGLKGGCKAAKAIADLPVPVLTLKQRTEFAIRAVMGVYKYPRWNKWAEAWLSGKDRTVASANAARYPFDVTGWYGASSAIDAAIYCAGGYAAASGAAARAVEHVFSIIATRAVGAALLKRVLKQMGLLRWTVLTNKQRI